MPDTGSAADPTRPDVCRTGLVVAVPAAEPLVAGFRRRFHADSVARRVPAHVTILFPFVTVEAFDAEVRDRVASHFREQQVFDASLVEVGSFPEHVWLAPAPTERFIGLITATCEQFPETPPYEGAFDSPEPHLTIGASEDGQSIDELIEAAEQELAPALPLRFRVDAATLLVEQADGTWTARERFPFG